jgi:Domain of unknown function (DUF4833)
MQYVRNIIYILCLLCVTLLCQARTASTNLFSIYRNMNANIVRYDVVTNSQNPIDAYWLMLAGNGHREELTWMERKMAYGFEVSNITPQGFTMQLVAYKKRLIRVEKAGESYRARMFIAGKPATLIRLFIFSEDGIIPAVRYVDLYGITDKNNIVKERISQ